MGFGTAGPGHPAAAATALAELVFSDTVMVVMTLSAVVLGLVGMRRMLVGLGVEGLPAVLGGPRWDRRFGCPGARRCWLLGASSASRGRRPVGSGWRDGTVAGRIAAENRTDWVGDDPIDGGYGLRPARSCERFRCGPSLGHIRERATLGVAGASGPIRSGELAGVVALALVVWPKSDLLRGGDPIAFTPSVWLAGGLATGVLLTLFVGSSPQATVAGVGGVVAVAGAVVVRIAPGLESSAGGLVLMALGLALAVGGVAAGFHTKQGTARAVLILSQVTVISGLATVGVAVVSGSWHLPPDRYTEALQVVDARSQESDVDRILFVGAELPGQARLIDGVPYKTMSSELAFSEGWLGVLGPADLELESVLRAATDPAELRAGAALGALGIRWIIVTAPSQLDPGFEDKLDLKLLPIGGETFRLYENVDAAPIARTSQGVAWHMSGARFVGEPAEEVRLAVNPAPFGQLDVPVVADGSTGEIVPNSDASMRSLAWVGAATLLLSVIAAAARLGDRT